MSSIKSHIQPQFFLKGFLAKKQNEKEGDALYVYRKGMSYNIDAERQKNNPYKAGLKNIAFVRNFYAFLGEDGNINALKYERKLENEIEGPANRILDSLRTINLLKGKQILLADILSNDDREKFARYVAAMYCRTKRGRRQFTFSIEKTVKDMATKGISYTEIANNTPKEELEKFDKHLETLDSDFDKKNGSIAPAGSFLQEFAEKSEKDESFPAGIFISTNYLGSRIFGMKWQIRLTPAEHKFFTGDDPVVYTDLRNPNAELIFPLSSNVVFCATNNQKFPEIVYREENYKFVLQTREVLARACTELYFSESCTWLPRFLNQR